MVTVSMEEVIRFDVIHGRCACCAAPVYFTRIIDWDGNRVNTLHCWNGHYESLSVEHVSTDREETLTQEQVEAILPFIGFVKLDEQNQNPD